MQQQITFTFAELLDQALRVYPELRQESGKPNTTAVARFYKKRGAAIAQPTISRAYRGKTKPSERLISATYKVFGGKIPKDLLRGESASTNMIRMFEDFKVQLSTLMLAKELEELPREEYEDIVRQIHKAAEREKVLRDALRSKGVTPIDKSKR